MLSSLSIDHFASLSAIVIKCDRDNVLNGNQIINNYDICPTSAKPKTIKSIFQLQLFGFVQI